MRVSNARSKHAREYSKKPSRTPCGYTLANQSQLTDVGLYGFFKRRQVCLVRLNDFIFDFYGNSTRTNTHACLAFDYAAVREL